MNKSKVDRSGNKNPFYGKHHTEETKLNNRLTHLGKYTGDKHYLFGKHHSEETKEKIRLSKLGRKLSKEHIEKVRLKNIGKTRSVETKKKISLANSGEGNGQWKGDDVKYKPLHVYVTRRLPKPTSCEFCNQIKPLDLANMTGIYDRDLNNWKYICRKCHQNYDRNSGRKNNHSLYL